MYEARWFHKEEQLIYLPILNVACVPSMEQALAVAPAALPHEVASWTITECAGTSASSQQKARTRLRNGTKSFITSCFHEISFTEGQCSLGGQHLPKSPSTFRGSLKLHPNRGSRQRARNLYLDLETN